MASAGPVSGIGSLFSRVLSLSESRVSACCAAVAGRCNKLPANVAKVIVVQQRQQQQLQQQQQHPQPATTLPLKLFLVTALLFTCFVFVFVSFCLFFASLASLASFFLSHVAHCLGFFLSSSSRRRVRLLLLLFLCSYFILGSPSCPYGAAERAMAVSSPPHLKWEIYERNMRAPPPAQNNH